MVELYLNVPTRLYGVVLKPKDNFTLTLPLMSSWRDTISTGTTLPYLGMNNSRLTIVRKDVLVHNTEIRGPNGCTCIHFKKKKTFLNLILLLGCICNRYMTSLMIEILKSLQEACCKTFAFT
jgi:hypothetical protein